MDIDLIGVGVDTRGVKQGAKELDNLGNSADKASRKADGLTKANDGVSKTSSIAARSVGSLAAAYAVLASARALGAVIDGYTKFNAQLKLATKTQDEFNQAFQSVKSIATTAQSDIGSIATLYARLSNSLSELGVEHSKIATISETVALGLKVAGASAGEASSVMLQLSQGFAAGALRGDEFNSMAENAPSLMKALAASMGITTGELREMAQEGEITREVLLKAFGDDVLLNKFREQAEEVETLSGAFQTMKNEFVLMVGKVAEKTGIVDLFTIAIDAGSQAMRSFNDLLTTGKINLDSFLPAYAKYREKMDLEKIDLGFQFAAKTGDPFSQAEIDKIAKFGTTLEVIPEAKALTEKEQKALDKLNKQQSDAAKRLYEEKEKLRLEEVKRVKDQNDYFFQSQMEQFRDKQKEELKAAKESDERVQKEFKEYQRLSEERERIAEREADAIQREYDRMSDNISRSLTDAIFRGFEEGKSFAENFLDSLKNMFKTTILQPIVQLAVNSTGLTSFMKSLNGAITGGESGGNTIMGALGNIKDVIGTLNGSLLEGIQGLSGDLISNGFDTLGRFIQTNSGLISKALPYAGAALQLINGDVKGAAFTGIGTAIGSIWGPIGGAIGGFLGNAVGGLFGGSKLPPRVTAAQTGTFSNGQYSGVRGSEYGDAISGGNSSLDALNERFSRTLGALLTGFGIDATIGTHSVITKKKSYETSFGATLNGESVGYNYQKFGKKDDMGAVFDAVVNYALTDVMVKAIQSSTLSDGIKKFFDATMDKDQIANAVTGLVSLKSALGDLPAVFDAARDAIDTTAYKTSVEAIAAQFAATQNFVELFYTDAEKRAIATNQLTTAFANLDQALPTSRDSYRKLVESINVSDEATRDLYNGLISLAPAMAQFFEAANAGLQVRNEQSFSNVVDFQRYQATAQNVGVEQANTNARLIEEVREMRKELAATNKTNTENVKYTRETRDILANVTSGGDAMRTEAA